MAQTTLPVRLVQCTQATTRQSVAFRLVVLMILLLIGPIMTGCGSGGEGDGLTLTGSAGDGSSAAAGPASASLSWDPVSRVLGYFIHYGPQSPGSPGSCAYAHSVFSSTPAATVAGLEANTTYYFAVSSYNGLESACSGEVSTVTGSV